MKRFDRTALMTVGMVTAGIACGFAASNQEKYQRAVSYYNSPEYANYSMMSEFVQDMASSGAELPQNQTERIRVLEQKLSMRREQEKKVKDLLTNMGYGNLYDKEETIDIYAGGNIQNTSLSVLPQPGQNNTAVER